MKEEQSTAEILALLAKTGDKGLGRLACYITDNRYLYFIRVSKDKIKGKYPKINKSLVEVYLNDKPKVFKRLLYTVNNLYFLQLESVLEFDPEDIKKIIPC